MKPEKIFTSELTASFKQYCNSHQLFYWRIKDEAFTKDTSFTIKKPFDGMCWGTGDFGHEFELQVLAMEYKAVQGKDRWYIRELKDHQIVGLQKAAEAGAYPLLILNFRGIDGKEKTKTWAIPLEQVLFRKEKGIKALTYEMLETEFLFYKVMRIKLRAGTYGWHVPDLFQNGILYEKTDLD